MPAKKKTTKRATARKTAAKRTTVKKVAPKKVVRATSAIKEPLTKTQLFTEIAENTELSKKQISAVFEELTLAIERHIKKRGPGVFTLPGLFKVQVQKKPARKARKGINPFTGEETMFKAKPASNVVKIRPLKKLKDMAA